MQILVLNGGSSSIKFSMFAAEASAGKKAAPRAIFEGELTGIGTSHAKIKIEDAGGTNKNELLADAQSLEQAITLVLDALEHRLSSPPDAVGHRVVHPGPHLHGHQRITEAVLKDLEAAIEFAPLHDPEAVQLIRAAMKRYPHCDHYACFDTVFHETMPVEATTYALPSEYRERGVRRYGFHGLSCESIVRQMHLRGDVPKRMAIAHLGSGCSVTALVDGCSVDTTMGLTPTGGVVMGTRSGDLDPGLVLYLLRQQQGDREAAAGALETLLNHSSGLVALSGMSNDVKAVRAAAGHGDANAELALKVFTRSVTKAIGGFCWLLGGFDAVVFAGGIGEHDAATRGDVLAGLSGIGVVVDDTQSHAAADGIQRISAAESKTEIFIVPAQEDLMIALHVESMARSGK